MANMGIASDLNNQNFQGATNPDSLLRARFYMRVIRNNWESTKQGRPIFQDEPYVEIMTPGNNLNIVDVPVREEHKIRFPREWAIFQNSQSASQVQGTPLEEWPTLSRSQAEEFKAVKFYTVEQVAGASDEQIQKIGMGGMMFREKAKAFLQAAKGSALAQQQVEELQKRDQQITELNNTVNRLGKQLEQLLNSRIAEHLPESPAPVATVDTTVKTKRKYTKRQPTVTGPDNA